MRTNFVVAQDSVASFEDDDDTQKQINDIWEDTETSSNEKKMTDLKTANTATNKKKTTDMKTGNTMTNKRTATDETKKPNAKKSDESRNDIGLVEDSVAFSQGDDDTQMTDDGTPYIQYDTVIENDEKLSTDNKYAVNIENVVDMAMKNKNYEFCECKCMKCKVRYSQ